MFDTLHVSGPVLVTLQNHAITFFSPCTMETTNQCLKLACVQESSSALAHSITFNGVLPNIRATDGATVIIAHCSVPLRPVDVSFIPVMCRTKFSLEADCGSVVRIAHEMVIAHPYAVFSANHDSRIITTDGGSVEYDVKRTELCLLRHDAQSIIEICGKKSSK